MTEIGKEKNENKKYRQLPHHHITYPTEISLSITRLFLEYNPKPMLCPFLLSEQKAFTSGCLGVASAHSASHYVEGHLRPRFVRHADRAYGRRNRWSVPPPLRQSMSLRQYPTDRDAIPKRHRLDRTQHSTGPARPTRSVLPPVCVA